MKIAQFIDTLGVGGAETMLIRLAEAIQQSDHQVTIFHFGNPYISETAESLNIEHVVIPYLTEYKSLKTIFQFSRNFSQLLKEHKIDVLHSHLYGSITGALWGCWRNKIPHIGTLHDKYMVEERVGRGCLLRIAQQLNTQLVAVSKDMQAFYHDYIPLAKKITCIYNGFDPKPSLLESNPQASIKNIGDPNATKIVSVGRLIPLKRHSHQIRELSQLLNTNQAELFIVGGGPEFERLQQLIVDLDLTEKVFLLGERDDVEQILHDADLFILTSASEGLSCSIIEALSAGLPCVVSDVGGNRELIEQHVNGFVYPLENEELLSAYVLNIIQEPKQAAAISIANKEKAQVVFSVQQMLNQYISAYQLISQIK
ncbi:glycosyltransferase [Aliikangiella sp. IMCC44632]